MAILGNDGSGASTTGLGTGRAWFAKWDAPVDGTITEIHITYTGAGETLDLGIYGPGSTDQPGAAYGLPGTVHNAVSGTTTESITGLSIPFLAGDVWLAAACLSGLGGDLLSIDGGGAAGEWTGKSVAKLASAYPLTDPAPTVDFGPVDRMFRIWVVYDVPCDGPTNDTPPAVAGDDAVGDTLTYTPGGWSGVGTITVGWDWWRRCGTMEELVQAGGTTRDNDEDDIDCFIFVVETAEDDDCPGEFVTADSNEIGPIQEAPAPPVNIDSPTITGSPFVGHTLVVDPGTWTGSPTFTYQWQIDCGGGFEDIVGETTTSLELTDEMVGCTVRCVVTATNGEGETDADSNEVLVEANVPAANRFCEGPQWRFIVTDLLSQTLTFLDRLATSRTAVYTLNAPAIATGVLPSDAPEVNILHTDDDPFVAEGNRMLFGFRQEIVAGSLEWVVRYGGLILQIEDIADSDNANTHYTAFDPLKLLFSRPVQTVDGDPVGPNGLSFTATRVDVIIGTLLLNTIVNNGDVHIDAGASYGGTGFYTGIIESLPQIDINFQQGMSVGDAIKILTDQNYCDILLTPVWDPENRPGTCCELSIVAQLGAVQDNAIFAWDKPSRSLVGISRLLEGTARANNVRYFAGQGGNVGSATVDDATSVAKYGEYWSQQFWPGQRLVAAVTALAEAALDLQKNGKDTVTISPIPGCTPLPFQEYFLGDRVPVYASQRFRQEIPQSPVGTAAPSTQYQRIYGMPIDIEDDSTEMIKQMLTSVQT